MTPERLRLIEEVYCGAAELPAERRPAFLESACAGDAELRRDVESLLLEADERRSPFATLVSEAAGSLAAGEPGGIVGRRVGAYLVTGVIGQGGMAEVYRAVRDDDLYRKEVAVKVVRRGMVSEFTLARFRHERQILASLEHPNIARLLDGGTTEDGLPYFVMERVVGVPVNEYCEAHGLPTRQRLVLFRQISAAVSYAHRNLIVHRDLKPSNVLVTADGTPKLLDFGIAKLLAPELSPAAVTVARTMTAVRLMTPEYAAPEQVKGEPVTTATDVYALGALLFEMLTGERAHNFSERTMAEIERVVCGVEAERPSLVVSRRSDAPARLRRELAGDLDNIVLTALRKEPDRRYQSAEQLSEDVRRHLEGRPVTARQDTLGYRAGKFVRRHKAGVISAAAAAVLLVSFAAAMAVQAARIARERDRANAVTEFLVKLFEVSSPGEARGNEVRAREILDVGAARVEREMTGEPELQAALMDTMGRVYMSLGLYKSAHPLLEKSLELRRSVLGAGHPEVAEGVSGLATLLLHEGDYGGAERAYREALELRRRAHGEGHAKVAESLNDLGELLRRRGKYDEAEPLLRRALELRRGLHGNAHQDVAYTLNNLAALLDDKGDYVAAEPLYREALELKRRVLGPDHPSVANTLNNLAFLLRNRGDDAGAEPLYREALALRRKVLGAEHPDVAVSLNNLGMLLRARGDFDAAEGLLREALLMKQKLLGAEHASTGSGLQNLADVLEAKGDFASAEPLYREALTVIAKSLPADHWRVGAARASYGSCLAKLRRFREAEDNLLTGYEVLKAALGVDNRRTVKAAAALTDLYDEWGKPAEAERYRGLLTVTS